MTLIPNTQLGRYEVRTLLGAGGMGEVYRAQDTELERVVALKVLLVDVAQDQVRLQRFIQEAKAASALNHPNILTIYEIGQANSTRFIATEFIDGTTLRARMTATEHMSAGEVLDVAVQVASALAAAHVAGIVHRDIKPENVMLRRDGIVKVLDFGLAKLTERPSTPTDTEAPTKALVNTAPGMVMGTAIYMSPEQAGGRVVDARTDIWSLGVLIYEMLAGHVPFEGETPTEIIARILEREPQPLARYAPDTPAELQRILTKALMKNRDERYQTVKDMLLDLKALKQELEFEAKLERSVAPDAHQSVSPKSDSLGAAAATAGGTANAATVSGAAVPQTLEASASHPTTDASVVIGGIKRHKLATLIAVLLVAISGVGLGFYLHARNTEIAIESIAVLPFVNQNHDAETEYLSDGLTESIINSLTQLPSLRVLARSTVFRYKGKETDPLAVGKELGVRAVLTGRMLQRGDNLSVSVELIDVRDNKQLWGERYERKVSDLLAVQREIAREITDNMRLKLSGADESRMSKRYTENTEAYHLYLRGRYYWNKRTAESLYKSIDYFNQAIERDPRYALAYAGLADAYQVLPSYTQIAPDETYPKARTAALRALELDNSLAEPHAALAVVKFEYEWDFAAAEREFKQAIELNPTYPSAHQWYSEFLTAMMRHTEALSEARRAQQLDPLSLIINTMLGSAYLDARQPEQATEQLKKTLELDPNFTRAHLFLWFAYEDRGMYEDGIAEFEKLNVTDGMRPERAAEDAAALREAYRASGAKGYWQKSLELAMKYRARPSGGPQPSDIASLYARLGDRDRAFEWLEKAFAARERNILNLRSNARFDDLRSDPRYSDLLRRIGFQ